VQQLQKLLAKQLSLSHTIITTTQQRLSRRRLPLPQLELHPQTRVACGGPSVCHRRYVIAEKLIFYPAPSRQRSGV
jgi:hypothetical protein